MFMPKDLFITHLILVAVKPELINEHHLATRMEEVAVDGEALRCSPSFRPLSGLLAVIAARTETIKGKYPLSSSGASWKPTGTRT